MTAPVDAPAAAGPADTPIRWILPAALLVCEYGALSVLVDFPTSGPALGIASAARLVVPASLGALMAGWLISRHGMRAAIGDLTGPLPPWRPWPVLPVQLVAFAVTVIIARRVLGPGAPPASIAGLLAVIAGALACAVLALATAAPFGWLARFVRVHAGAEIAAIGLGLLAWRAAALAEGLWGVLQGATLVGVGALLRILRPDAIVLPEESVVGLPGFEVAIAPVCSGVDGLGLVLVFQALWLVLGRGRLRMGRALVLLPLGAAAALAANVLRITALVLLGGSGRGELAIGAFHSKLGWLLFLGIALATVLAAEHVAWFRRHHEGAAADDEGVPRRTGAYVGPFVAAIAAGLLTSLWAEQGLDLWYGARVAAALGVLLLVRKELPAPQLSSSLPAVLVGAVVCAAWVAWPHSGGTTLPERLAQLAPSAQLAWMAVRLVGSILVLPLVEELAFRGFLLPWLVSSDFESVPPRAWTWPAVIGSSVAFGAIHDGLALGTISGAAFAFVRLSRGRVADAVLAHAIANAGIAVAVLAFGRWDLWN